MVLSRRGNLWIASVDRDPTLTVSGHNTRTARRLIVALIQERYGALEVEIEIDLSKAQLTTVQKYIREEQQLRSLADSVPKLRIRCIEDLLAMHLSQGEVASLLGMTRSHLAVSLRRATSSRVRRSTMQPAPRSVSAKRRSSRAQA